MTYTVDTAKEDIRDIITKQTAFGGTWIRRATIHAIICERTGLEYRKTGRSFNTAYREMVEDGELLRKDINREVRFKFA